MDWPGYFFFEEIMEALPVCKVILMVKEDSRVENLSYHFETMFTKLGSKLGFHVIPHRKEDGLCYHVLP